MIPPRCWSWPAAAVAAAGAGGGGAGGGGGGGNYVSAAGTGASQGRDDSRSGPSVKIDPVLYKTSTTLQVSNGSPATTEDVTYTATVSNEAGVELGPLQTGPPRPQGPVDFTAVSGATAIDLGPAPIVPGSFDSFGFGAGTATLTPTHPLPPGVWSVTATYNGDTSDPENSLQGSTSTVVTERVGTAPVVTATPMDATIGDGQVASLSASASGDPMPTVQLQTG